jgi:hypothetical protein
MRNVPKTAEESKSPIIRIEFRQLRRSNRGGAGERRYKKMDAVAGTHGKRIKQLKRDSLATTFALNDEVCSSLVLTSNSKSWPNQGI